MKNLKYLFMVSVKVYEMSFLIAKFYAYIRPL